MVWVVFTVLTGLAVFAVLWPLSRTPRVSDPRELDVAFYKAQTAEIDRDVSRGVIGETEAAVARNEAARRLVAVNQAAEALPQSDTTPSAVSSPWAPRLAAIGAMIFVPLVALGLYMRIGAPNLPDLPLEARLNGDPATMDMTTVVARIERNVRRDPNDGRGWALLARIYTRIGRERDAVDAYRNEIRTLGPSEERLSGLGEAETAVNGGTISPEARADFDRAVKLDPRSPRARFYVGLAAEQAGDKTQALSVWKQLVAEAPKGASWLPAVQARIAAVAGEPAAPTTDAGATGAADVAAKVAALPAADQQAMIHRMVDGLATRLKSNGTDLEGWLRLMRAYRVLDEGDKAKGAWADARRQFAADPAATKRLNDLAQELGLEG